MILALERARIFVGATAPNPPVGAVGLAADGTVLSVQAHERAGTGHAEARVIEECRALGRLHELHTVVVTLEPCNHEGRTPACSEALLQAGVKKVIYGADDPNPRVVGGGAGRLRQAGVEVIQDPKHQEACAELIRTFSHWSRTGLPWVTVKTAWNLQGSMVPEVGAKTFTTPESLRFAHELRKRADALITGSGTVLSDSPLFTVRQVEDHPEKKRILVLLDRRKRVSAEWKLAAENRGFEVVDDLDLEGALYNLGQRGCLEALVEAGPELSGAILSSGFWNSHVQIRQITPSLDRIEISNHVHWNHPKSRAGHFKQL
ncbi:MAG: bifunctional diaminohydroxyphosphoribosylaminopyrimidine deaminase/5-amino-6-(5-phosphoribosylamino)uracil reductase RibD [Methylotenera sp.]|nr:bifunctional diaminohydroxyphosphoribosylaminopyrimidine deaminase/5-amino-6-(5-phosphoribosylamino)uracil reductase RibD [Oligoflexia bacterium]